MGTVFISNVEDDRFMASSLIAEIRIKGLDKLKIMARLHTARMIAVRAIVSKIEFFGGLEKGRLGIDK